MCCWEYNCATKRSIRERPVCIQIGSMLEEIRQAEVKPSVMVTLYCETSNTFCWNSPRTTHFDLCLVQFVAQLLREFLLKKCFPMTYMIWRVSTDGVFLRAQVLLADPEERRSFMDMRLLLVLGDIGDAVSLPASPSAGLSPRRISRQEPVEAVLGTQGRREEVNTRIERYQTSHHMLSCWIRLHTQTRTHMWRHTSTHTEQTTRKSGNI